MTALAVWMLLAFGITNIVVNGDIFVKVRDFFADRSNFVHSLITCEMCFSTWVGFLLSLAWFLLGLDSPLHFLPVYLRILFEGAMTSGGVSLIFKAYRL